MHQGNWKCSTCGGAITELPFEPRSESGLTCRDCYVKSKGSTQPAVDTPTGVSAPSEQEVPDDVPFDAGMSTGPQEDDGLTAVSEAPAEKPKHTGDWKCTGCGAAITSLPFEPRSTENLKCLDCFKKSKA